MNNVRIAIRDSTDSYNIDFFDNVSGIHYHTADLQRFLAGSSSILTLKYRTKDIDKVTAGCKLAFRYKGKDFWLSIMEVKKNGFDKELTAFSLILEANNEDKGPFSADKGMTIAEYIKKFDAESSLTIGVNEVADKSIKLEWTGTDTMLARLFSVANNFDAELEFVTELNDDYSLKRHVLNIYRTGNLGKNATGLPVRVGRELKVINYSESIKNLRTVVFATGKDGLTIEGLSKKVYDDNGELLYETSGAFIRAVQSRDRFPSVGKNTTDNYALLNLGETEYETKEALYGYMLSELKKRCLPEMDFEVEGVIDGDVGDTKTLIDDVFHEPELYVQARISELTESMITGENTNVVLSNYERKYSQIADSLLKQVEALAEDAAPYIVRLSTDNGYNFKNGQGTSTITAKLEKYSKIVNANWKWLINNSIVSETSSVTINASQVTGTLNVVAVASVDGNEVAREYITFTNSDDGVGIKSIKRYYTTNDQAEGVTAGGQNWSTKPTTVTADKNYMWSYDVITYTNDTSLVTEPAVIGARGDDGLDADTTGITEALDKAKQELTALSANIEKVRDDSLAAVVEAKQQLTAVSNDLNTAKQDLQTQASQLTAQANAQSELTKRVSSVEETANGTKTTVSELSKTVDSNTKNITSVTARTKTVEDDLTSTKTTLSQVQTTANSASQKTATLETGLNGVKADLTATTATADTTKTNLANYQASNDKAVANLQSSLKTTDGNVSSLQTKVEAIPGQISSAINAVEGKIPTNVSTRNLILKSNDLANPHKQAGANTTVTSTDDYFVIRSTGYTANAWGGMSWNMSISEVTAGEEFSILMPVYIDSSIDLDNGWTFNIKNHLTNTTAYSYGIPVSKKDEWFNVAITFKTTKDVVFDTYPFYVYLVKNGLVRIKPPMLVRGSLIPSDYQPAFEDTESDITKLSSEIKQTADGMTLLATKTELSTAKSDLQSGITTATNKANTAQSTADTAKTNASKAQTTADSAVTKANAAQSTADNNAKTISTHTTQISALNDGLSAKVSQTDFNTLSGRVTTAENNITAKANELSSKISSVEGQIPTETGLRNYVLGTGTAKSSTGGKLYDLSSAFDDIADNATLIIEFDWSVTAPTSTSKFRINRVIAYSDGTANQWNNTIQLNNGDVATAGTSGHYSGTFKKIQYNGTAVSSRYLNLNQTTTSGTVTISNLSIRVGSLKSDWQPAPEDYDSKLASAQSEIKQTTDAISASVSALDSSTVKTASLNLDNNGFVTKVGKTVNGNTFATMIAQNESDVQIIAKKMKVSSDMIVDGAITGEKIQANSIDVSKISGLDATYLKAKIETAMVDWLKGKTIVADNGATKIDLLSGYINFDSDTPAIRRVTSGIPTQFLKFLRSHNNSVTTIGSNRDGSESSTNDSFAGIKITSGDSLEQTEIISDQIYFFTGTTNRQGWQMSTVSGEDNRQITLFPSGNPTKSNIYASDYFIKGSNGWVKLIDFINYFNTCMKHLQNHTGRTDIWNAFQL